MRRIPDLVADLRQHARNFFNKPALLVEAADEIERLRDNAGQPENRGQEE